MARTSLGQINYVILVQTSLNNKETTDKTKWAETGITTCRLIMNVRVSQVRVVIDALYDEFPRKTGSH